MAMPGRPTDSVHCHVRLCLHFSRLLSDSIVTQNSVSFLAPGPKRLHLIRCSTRLRRGTRHSITGRLNEIASFLALNGGPGLFLFCLLAATILPISSEAALLGAMSLGMDAWEALGWASAGNCAGVALNYLIGHVFSEKVHAKLDRGKSGRKALQWVDHYGVWCLLLSWTPFLGDPLTYAAGIFRIPFHYIIWIAFPLRVARSLVFAGFYV